MWRYKQFGHLKARLARLTSSSSGPRILKLCTDTPCAYHRLRPAPCYGPVLLILPSVAVLLSCSDGGQCDGPPRRRKEDSKTRVLTACAPPTWRRMTRMCYLSREVSCNSLAVVDRPENFQGVTWSLIETWPHAASHRK